MRAVLLLPLMNAGDLESEAGEGLPIDSAGENSCDKGTLTLLLKLVYPVEVCRDRLEIEEEEGDGLSIRNRLYCPNWLIRHCNV